MTRNNSGECFSGPVLQNLRLILASICEISVGWHSPGPNRYTGPDDCVSEFA